MNVVQRLLNSAMYLLLAILSLQSITAVRAIACNGDPSAQRSMHSVANDPDEGEDEEEDDDDEDEGEEEDDDDK